MLDAAKHILIWGSTPDAVLRLYKTDLEISAKEYLDVYFNEQCHDSLCDFLQYRSNHKTFGGNFIQVCSKTVNGHSPSSYNHCFLSELVFLIIILIYIYRSRHTQNLCPKQINK